MIAQPFAFDRVFPAEARSRSADALALEVSELELEVRRLKLELAAESARSRAEGRAEALADLQAERDTALLAAADALHAALEELEDRFEGVEARVVRIGAELALEAADFLAARQLERDPCGAIEDALGRALRQVRRGEPIEVRVHPSLEARIEGLVAERQSRDRRRLFLTIVADEAVPPGDARLSWESGDLTLDRHARRAAAWGEMESMLHPR